MEFSPIVLDSIFPDSFPAVELYVKQDKSLILYKPHDVKLTTHNLERLRDGGTEYIYINAVNSDVVQANLEKNLLELFASTVLPKSSKDLIFCQMMINCITDVFKNPGKAIAFHKCRTMLGMFSLVFEDRNQLFQLFSKLEHQYEKYRAIHSAQVAILAMYMYERVFGAERAEVMEIGAGAMLHDIGMLYIASSILEKNDMLSESEYQKIKFHPRHGHKILSHVGIKEQVLLDIVLDHHERHDGNGYPRGLSGDKIPKHAMVVSICSIYCALTMNRPYKCAATPQQALKTMKAEKSLFDPAIFGAFLELMTGAHPSEKSAVHKSGQAAAAAAI